MICCSPAPTKEANCSSGLQLHPEVTHTQNGIQILKNFAVGICGAKQNWTMAKFVDQEIA